MTNLSFKEDHISQIPALQLLQKLGYTYLPPEEVQQLRGERNDRVLLEPILRTQLATLNTLHVSATQTARFSEQNIEKGIEALRKVPIEEGYLQGNEYVYNLLTLGKALEETIQGDKRSYTLRYIDWKHPERNQFHVAEEFPVWRSGSGEHYRPDLVLFVNGIPLIVIECKRPDIKDSLQQAISQHLRNQKEDGIRTLYTYSALLLAIATSSASYGTTGTAEKFWGKWQEQFTSTQDEQEYNHALRQLVNTPLSAPQKEKLFAERFRYVRDYFDRMEQAPILPCEQDRYLYSLCRPERLLELIYHFTLYDKGVKKVARYQQYAIIREVMQRILPLHAGRRKGGVIWHTQGSGKSLTMVMLAQAIASEKSIRNPRIILVTDRTDLDRQITGTFRKCDVPVVNAHSGQHLTELLESREDAVITTVINKFETAVKRIKQPLTDPNIFVLVDEGHRSQYGEMSVRMQKALPNACFIAMTGTPLMRKEKSTAKRFGGMIEPIYTVDQAVRDGAVVPLLYEGRIVPQVVHEGPIDTFFNMVCEPLTEEQRVDLKKKFNRNDQLSEAEQRIFTIAWDISRHFRENWQGTPFKGQLVCARKRIAIKYKEFFDQIGIVSTQVLITSPDDREGEETAYGDTSNTEVAFWKKMMDQHGTAKKYEENTINQYKYDDHPEIIIVVDKLLTGFDEPRNTVMYIDRKLKEHTLLQAIARVNRVHEGKQHGYIIDYYGVAEQLHDAINLYAQYDPEDMEGLYTDISEEYAKLPQKHSELWDVFKTIANKQDLEAYAELLRMEDIRQEFYERLSAYASCLKVALSSNSFHDTHTEAEIDCYKKDLQMFIKLRSAVQQRYSDRIDYKKYEAQIQKLIDTHIESSEVEVIVELIDILDKKRFTEEIERITGEAARADTIASRTSRHITERMDQDPAFYRKFSALLKETIEAYQQGRISAAEYLKQVTGQMESVRSHRDNDLPDAVRKNPTAAAYYGLCATLFREKTQGEETTITPEITTASALALESILRSHIFDGEIAVVDWQMKSDLIKRMRLAMEDYLIDEIGERHAIDFTYEEIDNLIDELIVVAKARFA